MRFIWISAEEGIYTQRHKWIYICTFHIYWQSLMKFGISHLHRMLLKNGGFHGHQQREYCTSIMGINKIYWHFVTEECHITEYILYSSTGSPIQLMEDTAFISSTVSVLTWLEECLWICIQQGLSSFVRTVGMLCRPVLIKWAPAQPALCLLWCQPVLMNTLVGLQSDLCNSIIYQSPVP